MTEDSPIFAEKVGPAKREAQWAHHHRRSSGRVQVRYNYRSDYIRIFERTFNNAEEYALWWASIRHDVVIGGEAWPRILCGRKGGYLRMRKSGKQSVPAPSPEA